jgi:hypothetical protein
MNNSTSTIAVKPHRPGPQGPNRIAATFREQFVRAMQPRPPKPLPKRLVRGVRAVVAEEIRELIQDLPEMLDRRIDHALSGRNGVRRAV